MHKNSALLSFIVCTLLLLGCNADGESEETGDMKDDPIIMMAPGQNDEQISLNDLRQFMKPSLLEWFLNPEEIAEIDPPPAPADIALKITTPDDTEANLEAANGKTIAVLPMASSSGETLYLDFI